MEDARLVWEAKNRKLVTATAVTATLLGVSALAIPVILGADRGTDSRASSGDSGGANPGAIAAGSIAVLSLAGLIAAATLLGRHHALRFRRLSLGGPGLTLRF
jgi:hypothetical protein